MNLSFISRIRCDASPRKRLPRLAPMQRVEGLSFGESGVEARFEALVADGVLKLLLFGDVGDPDGITSDKVSGALAGAGPTTSVLVQLNSLGGDYFEGVTIYNLLRAHITPEVKVQILGVAASAGSVVALAGDRIEMARGSEMMIHRATTLAAGNAKLMAKASAILEKLDGDMAQLYASRARSSTAAKMLQLMDAETWLDPQEAIALGLADAEMQTDSIGRPNAKAEGAAPKSIRELERALRGLGYARSAAPKMATAAFQAMGSGSNWKALNDRISAVTASIKRKHHNA